MKTRQFLSVQNIKFCVSILAAAAVLFAAGCATGGRAPAGEVQLFDNAQISMVYTVATARYGTVTDAPGGGGFAFYFSDAKTMVESGTYEVLLSRARPSPNLDVRGNRYLEFEIMTSNLELFDDMVGFFPRLRNNDIYVQFQGTYPLLDAIAGATEVHQWVSVSVPVIAETIHARHDEFRTVMPRVNGILFRFILQDQEPIDGRIYIRNVQFR